MNEQFHECLTYFHPYFKKLTWCHFWIAGGALRDFFLLGKVQEESDIDFYFSNKENYQIALGVFKKTHEIKYENENTTRLEKDSEKIDLIKIYWPDPRECIRSFDFTCCACALGRSEIYNHEAFFMDIARRRISVNRFSDPKSILNRINKYIDKGFNISKTELAKVERWIKEQEVLKTTPPVEANPFKEVFNTFVPRAGIRDRVNRRPAEPVFTGVSGEPGGTTLPPPLTTYRGLPPAPPMTFRVPQSTFTAQTPESYRALRAAREAQENERRAQVEMQERALRQLIGTYDSGNNLPSAEAETEFQRALRGTYSPFHPEEIGNIGLPSRSSNPYGEVTISAPEIQPNTASQEFRSTILGSIPSLPSAENVQQGVSYASIFRDIWREESSASIPTNWTLSTTTNVMPPSGNQPVRILQDANGDYYTQITDDTTLTVSEHPTVSESLEQPEEPQHIPEIPMEVETTELPPTEPRRMPSHLNSIAGALRARNRRETERRSHSQENYQELLRAYDENVNEHRITPPEEEELF
jgi:hypothetical protein